MSTHRNLGKYVSLNRIVRGWPAAYLVLALAYVLYIYFTPVGIYTAAIHDDALFWQRARGIVAGDWLGAYDNRTLVKGAGYSLFLAFNHLIRLPVTVTLALVYALACAVTALAVVRLGVPRWFGFALYVVMLLHPAVVPNHIVRDNIYPALALFVVAGALRLWTIDSRRVRTVAVTAGYGVMLALFWITREEGIWIVPGLLILLIGPVVAAWRRRTGVGTPLLHIGVLLGTAGVVIGAVMAANAAVYGRPVLTDTGGPPYSDVMADLTSIQAGPDLPFVPVTEEERRAAYRVSPAFAELRSTLEGDNGWRGIGCPDGCDDYAAGWWEWALRDAAAAQGYYSSSSEAAAYWQRVADELGTACDDGELTCAPAAVPVVGAITGEDLSAIPGKVPWAWTVLTTQLDFGGASPSWEPTDELDRVREFLGQPLSTRAPPESDPQVSGWFTAPGETWIQLTCPDGREIPIDRLPSPDLASGFDNPDLDQNRFSFTAAGRDGCAVELDGRNPGQQIPLASLFGHAPISQQPAEGATINFDTANRVVVPPPPDWGVGVLTFLGEVYGALMPLLALVGMFSAVIAVGLALGRRRLGRPFVWVSIALWGMVAARVLILVLLDITTMPAISVIYYSAAYPLLVLASATSIAALAREVERAAGRGRHAGAQRDADDDELPASETVSVG